MTPRKPRSVRFDHRQQQTGQPSQLAFLDQTTNRIYPFCHSDDNPTPIGPLDGLPANLVLARDEQGQVRMIKPSVVVGRLFRGRFSTRGRAAVPAK